MKKHNKNAISHLKKELAKTTKEGKRLVEIFNKTKEGTEEYVQSLADVQDNKDMVSDLKNQIEELQNIEDKDE